MLNRVRFSAAPWTVATRLLCPGGFSSQEYWGGMPFPPPGDLPHDSGMEPMSCVSCNGRQILYHLGNMISNRSLRPSAPLRLLGAQDSEVGPAPQLHEGRAEPPHRELRPLGSLPGLASTRQNGNSDGRLEAGEGRLVQRPASATARSSLVTASGAL